MKYFLMVMLLPLFASAQILRPNLIINGDMSLDQRGSATSAVTCGSDVYGVDRFSCTDGAATGVATMARTALASTDAPYVLGHKYSTKMLATTGFTFGAAESAFIRYHVEGFDFATVAQKTATLSFWVRAKKTGAACLAALSTNNSRAFVSQYTIASADTWQEVSVPINFKTGTASGTWDYTTGRGVKLYFASSFGTNFGGATSGAWGSSELLGTSACQTNNLLAATNDYVEITGVRLTEGAQKVPFVKAGGGSYAAELALAERYTQCLGSAGLGISSFLAAGKWFQTIYHSTPLRVTATSLFRTDGGALTGLNCGSTAGDVYIPAQSGANPATCTAGSALIKIDTDLSSNPKMTFLTAGGTSISGSAGVISPSMAIQNRTLCVSAEL